MQLLFQKMLFKTSVCLQGRTERDSLWDGGGVKRGERKSKLIYDFVNRGAILPNLTTPENVADFPSRVRPEIVVTNFDENTSDRVF